MIRLLKKLKGFQIVLLRLFSSKSSLNLLMANVHAEKNDLIKIGVLRFILTASLNPLLINVNAEK